MLDDNRAFANFVWRLVLSRSGRHVLDMLLCAELVSCAVLSCACGRCSTTTFAGGTEEPRQNKGH